MGRLKLSSQRVSQFGYRFVYSLGLDVIVCGDIFLKYTRGRKSRTAHHIPHNAVVQESRAVARKPCDAAASFLPIPNDSSIVIYLIFYITFTV